MRGSAGISRQIPRPAGSGCPRCIKISGVLGYSAVRATPARHERASDYRPNYGLSARSPPRSPAASSCPVSTVPHRAGERKHGGFDANLGRAAVQHHRDVIAKGFADMFGGGRAKVRVKRFALGAAIGTPASRIRARAIGWRASEHPPYPGRRSADPEHAAVSAIPGERAGPKAARQHFGARRPFAHQAARHFDGAHVNDQRAVGGRPFAAKILSIAAGSSAFAPSPYTVSVGKATRLLRLGSARRRADFAHSGRSSFPSPAVLPVCLKTRKACISRSRSPSKTRSTSPMESLVR